MNDVMNIRSATTADLPQIRALYRETILHVNRKDYDARQVAAWAARADDAEAWKNRLNAQYLIVVERPGGLGGFASITGDGYLDLLFVHKDCQGLGIAAALLAAVEAHAGAASCATVRADVSITAKPFFERSGFRVEREQEVRIGEIPFTNYRMTKDIGSRRLSQQQDSLRRDMPV